jgi:alpha-mannosidase
MRLVRAQEGRQPAEIELRLYETTGSPADVTIRLGCPVARVRQTNFLGEPCEGEGKVDFAGGEIRFRIRPWKIVTLRLAPAIEGNGP